MNYESQAHKELFENKAHKVVLNGTVIFADADKQECENYKKVCCKFSNSAYSVREKKNIEVI